MAKKKLPQNTSKEYHKPQLKQYGKLTDITQGGSKGIPEGFPGMMMMMRRRRS